MVKWFPEVGFPPQTSGHVRLRVGLDSHAHQIVRKTPSVREETEVT